MPRSSPRPLEERLAEGERKVRMLRSKMAVQRLAKDQSNKRILRIIRDLRYVVEHPEQVHESVLKLAQKAHQQFVDGVANSYDIDRDVFSSQPAEEEGGGGDQGEDDTSGFDE